MNADKYFIDTNIFVRFFVRDSERSFRECSAVFESLAAGDFVAVTSSAVIAEIHWLLKSYYKIDKQNIVGFVVRALSLSHLKIDNRGDTALANVLFRDASVKFIDALIASHPDIQNGSMTVISYDKDFDKLGVKRIEPKALVRKISKRAQGVFRGK